MIDFSQYHFHPVILLPSNYEVYDFTKGYDPNRKLNSPFGIGKYDEQRVGMYTTEMYTKSPELRNIHMGIDIGAPAGTPVHAFYAGEVFLTANNHQEGDYGYTLITKHILHDTPLFVLHGHLSAKSIEGKKPGQKFQAGEVIAWLGEKHENGGWNPHLHFQVSLEKPEVCDMPGVVSESQREKAKRIYLDPQCILGKLY